MKVLLKEGLLVLIPETDGEVSELARWRAAHGGHVLHARADEGLTSLELHDLGRHADACRVPINVVSGNPDPGVRLISNLAATPFELDGRRYRSVESFWQGLKFPSEAERARIAACDGPHALSEGSRQGYGKTIVYEGAEIAVGTHEHWRLMERACAAKFEQNDDARTALIATGERPLVHIVKRDSHSIPGVIMAQIWMRLRGRWRRGVADDVN